MLSYAESAIIEDDAVAAARGRAEELGATAVSPATGALLAFLARSVNATNVVGMRADGVLTTIDPEPLHHRAARASFAGAAVSSGRTRLINGAPRDVLPRLSDRSYDLVFVDGPQLELPDFVVEAIRLLRPGGVLVVHDATAEGAIGDPERNDPMTDAARSAAIIVAEDDRLLPVVIPLGKGVLAAAKAPDRAR